jgi:starch synthase
MRVLFVTSECLPYVKTGGLGDVAGALPAALRAEGADVRLLLPGYPGVLEKLENLKPLRDLRGMPGLTSQAPARLLSGRGVDGSTVYALDVPSFFGRKGNPYLGPDGKDWSDNHLRFAALGRTAALIGLDGDGGRGRAGWKPEVVHGHDWQAGLAAAYLRHPLWPFGDAKRPGTVFTIHNMAFQGLYPPDLLPKLGIPWDSYTPNGLEFHSQLSFLKAGLVYSDRLTTVSPTYATEIQGETMGFGLDGLLRARAAALEGILNGIDTDAWDSRNDPLLVSPYDADQLDAKTPNKAELQRIFGLAPDLHAPLFGIVSRLTDQKGIDLVVEALPYLVEKGAQLVVLGTGSAGLEQALAGAARRFPGRVGLVLGYDEALSHRLQAGVDVLMVPSRFEPCGLTQMYALRYGSLPLVAHVGGLADTVTDVTEDSLAAGTATGFTFAPVTVAAMLPAIDRALTLYHRSDLWRQVQRNAMGRDVSWAASARNYVATYKAAMEAAGQ